MEDFEHQSSCPFLQTYNVENLFLVVEEKETQHPADEVIPVPPPPQNIVSSFIASLTVLTCVFR